VAQVVGHKSLRMIEDVYSHLTTEDSHDALMEVLSARRRR
jgi:hypothetical protein